MARMRPELSEHQLDALPSAGEAKFYRCCRDQLDDRYLVLHSVAWVRPSSGSAPRDGETDFVVFDPQGGFTVVEVKGGGVAFDPRQGWHSVDRHANRHPIKDPFRQATEQKHVVVRALRDHPRWPRLGIQRIVAGHAVVFPDVHDIGPLASLQCPRPILGGRPHLLDVQAWLHSVNAYWGSQVADFQPLGAAGLAIAEDIFCKPVEVRPLVSSELEDEEVIRIRLTEQQARLLRSLGGRKRAAVCGGAGTGKTLLAVQKAQRLAADGNRTLLLCYNRPLADHLKDVIGDNPKLLPMSFHQLCDWFARRARSRTGRDLLAEAKRAYPTEDFYDVHLPWALALSTEVMPDERFDAIVVDEGQDFREEFWLPLELLLRDPVGSLLYVFYDQNQAVYKRVSSFPIDDEPFVLTVNCRNTKFVHEAAYCYFQGDVTDPPAIEGAPIVTITAPDNAAQAERLHAEISRLLKEEKVPPSAIVVLVPSQNKNAYYHLLRARQLPNGIKWAIETHREPQRLLVDTIHRFKGLEAGIIFLWGIDSLEPTRDRETIYVGISRAKSRLYLVGTVSSTHSLLAYAG